MTTIEIPQGTSSRCSALRPRSIAVLLGVTLAGPMVAQDDTEFRWRPIFSEAFEEAQLAGLPLLVYFPAGASDERAEARHPYDSKALRREARVGRRCC